MKKSNIAKIAALRACLNRFVYRKDSMISHAKDYLGENLKFEMEDVVNTRRHEAVMFTIYDENGEYRQFQAEICTDREEFTFKGIGLEECVHRCNEQLIYGINNSTRINHKQAWIIEYRDKKNGLWKVLVSYYTVIAAWNINSNIIYLQRNARRYSNTTSRHLSDFEKHVNCVMKSTNETAVFKWACFEG